MANVPATTNQSADASLASNEADSSSAPSGKGLNFASGFGGLDVLRQAGLMLGLAVSVAIGFSVVLWSQSDNYQPVYGNMAGYDVGNLMEALEAEQISYRIEPNSGVILVPSDGIASVRMRLAAAGVTRYDGTGYELLDAEQALGTSSSMEASRIKRSQEGELQRTISSFRNIQSARVHIAIPERAVFVRTSSRPTASVFLTLNGNGGINSTQVSAITNLVAASVPGLNVEDVTVVDQRGNLLSRKESNSNLEIAGKQFDYIRNFEQSMVDRINSMLAPILGMDRFRAEVTAQIDFTSLEQADEQFDPQSSILRSERSLDEVNSGGGISGGIPGALSNQPPLDGAAPQEAQGGTVTEADAAMNRRVEASRSYEINRSISYTNHDPVNIRRLSVAVVLDDHMLSGAAETTPWNEAEIEQIATLIRDTVGYSEIRGDSVTVINNAFYRAIEVPIEAIAIWEQPWVMDLGKQATAGLLVLFLVFAVLRPVLNSLANVGSESRQLALAAAQGGYGGLDMGGGLQNELASLANGEDVSLPNPKENYARQLNTVKGLVAEDPSRVAAVVKDWVGSDDE